MISPYCLKLNVLLCLIIWLHPPWQHLMHPPTKQWSATSHNLCNSTLFHHKTQIPQHFEKSQDGLLQSWWLGGWQKVMLGIHVIYRCNVSLLRTWEMSEVLSFLILFYFSQFINYNREVLSNCLFAFVWCPWEIQENFVINNKLRY